MGFVDLWIQDKKPAGALADPLHKAWVTGAPKEGFDAIQWIGRAAAVAFVWLGPFIDHGKRQTEVGGHLFGAGLLKYFPQKLVRMHGGTMWNTENIGKRNGWKNGPEL